MEKLNCWEFHDCGRQPGGKNVSTLGVCPASTLSLADGFLDGKNGGRACVYVTGTFCSGTIQGTFKDKEKNCIECAFYKQLRNSGTNFSVLTFKKYVQSKNVPIEVLTSQKEHLIDVLEAI